MILDLQCGLGATSAALIKRFPAALIVPIDPALELLRKHVAPKKAFPWFRKSSNRICGEATALPLAPKSVDMVWSSLLPLSFDAPNVIRELKRVLKPGGLLMLSTLGPDSLKELRAAFSQVDSLQHIQPQVDMHDLGDMLAHEGFQTPVVDMEMITLTYPDVKTIAGICAQQAQTTRSESSHYAYRQVALGRRRARLRNFSQGRSPPRHI